MGTYAGRFGPHAPDDTYVAHGYDEHAVRHRRGRRSTTSTWATPPGRRCC